MPPETDQVLAAFLQRLAHVESGNAAAGALALVLIGRDQDRGPVIALHEARGHDPEHAGVPAVGPEHDRGGQLRTQRLQLVERLLEGGLVDLLPHGVVFFEALRDRHRLARLGREEEPHAALGVPEPSGRVDSGRQDVRHVTALDALGAEPGDFLESDDSQFGGMTDPVQAELGEDPVLSPERNHVRDGAERDQVQVLVHEIGRQGAGPVLREPLHELQHDPDSRELLERVRAVAALRIQDRVRIGQHPERLVVVGHDHVDAVLLGELDLVRGGDAAIRGDDQADPPLLCHVDAADREPVAVADPVGNEVGDLPPELHERGGQKAGRGDAVDVVVPVDQDRFPLVDRLPYPRGGAVHVPHREGVQEPIHIGLEEILDVGG